MKKRTLLIISLLIVLTSYSQSIKWGEVAKTDRASGYTKALGWHNGYLYTMEVDASGTLKMGGTRKFEKLSEELKVESTIEIDLEDKARIGFTHSQIMDNQFEICNLYYKNGAEFRIDYFDLKGNFINRKTVFSIEDSKVSLFKELRTVFNKSNDKKNAGLIIINTPKGEFNKFTLEFSKFNHLGEDLKQFKVDLSSDRSLSDIYIKKYLIDSKGNNIIWISEDLKDTEERNNRFLVINNSGELLTDQSLNNEDIELGFEVMTLTDNDKLYFAGTLDKLDGNRRSKLGFFLGNVNTESYKIEKIESYPYSEEFFEGIGYKVKNSGKIKFDGWYDLNIIADDSEIAYLIADHEASYRSTGYSSQEMLVIPFQSDLTLGDTKVIPRYLNSYSPMLNGLGYFGFINSDKLHLVYTDNRKNIETTDLGDLKEADNPKDRLSAIYCATVEMDKEVRRTIIAEDNKIDGYLIPQKCLAEDGRFIVNLGNRNKVLYGELKFE